MWKIILNEWTYLVRNRILISVSFCFVLILFLSVFLGVLQTNNQFKYYETSKDEIRKKWENIDNMNPHGAAHYGTYVFKPQNLLSSLDEGVNSVVGNVLRIEGHVQNEIVFSEASQMQTISKFGKLKCSLLLQYIIPLLLLFLAFQAISAEKKSGRLKLLLLQGCGLSKLVWGKAISVWLYGLFLLFLTLFIYSMLNINQIDMDILTRLFVFSFSYALYYFIITVCTVFFSTLSKTGTSALTTMLGLWIIWTIFLPNIIMSSLEKWHELPSRHEFKLAMKEDRSEGIDGHNPSDNRSEELKEQILSQYGVSQLTDLPINFDGIRMQADEEYGNMVWDKHFGTLRSILDNQKKSYQYGGLVNPFISLQNLSMGLTGSDNFHHQEFLVQAETYRRSLIKSLNDKHAYGGSKTGDWSWTPGQDFYKSIPDFHFKTVLFNSVSNKYLIDLIFLIGWALLGVILLNMGINKIKLI